MSDERLYRIRQLEEETRKLADTPQNRRREALWSDKCEARDYNWHPLPKEKGKMPYSFEIERMGYARMLGFSLVKFYTDPIEFLYRSLEIAVFKFKTFSEDVTPISKIITYWPGVGYDASLMGVAQTYTEQDAWVGGPILNDRVPLESIACPDFFDNPVMLETHAFYQAMRRALSDDFTINFPQWCRSPWSVAWAMCGIENLCVWYYDDPEWVKGLVDLLAEYRVRWSEQRAKYLGVSLTPTNFYNDEVASPTISPRMYRDVILPSEQRISQAFGGINYWHSCGVTDPFMADIQTIPDVAMVHVSPWSSPEKAAATYGRDKVIECALNPLDDVLTPTRPDWAARRIASVRDATADFYSVCRADGFTVVHDVPTDIRLLQDWIDTANRLLL